MKRAVHAVWAFIKSAGTWTAVLSGIIAGGLVFGIAELISAFVAALASPFQALGSVVVDNVPPFAKDIAIELFGTNDKLFLLITLGVVALVGSAVLGIVALNHLKVSLAAVGLLGVAMILASLTRTGADFTYALPSLAGVVLGGAALFYFTKINPYRKVVSHG